MVVGVMVVVVMVGVVLVRDECQSVQFFLLSKTEHSLFHVCAHEETHSLFVMSHV